MREKESSMGGCARKIFLNQEEIFSNMTEKGKDRVAVFLLAEKIPAGRSLKGFPHRMLGDEPALGCQEGVLGYLFQKELHERQGPAFFVLIRGAGKNQVEGFIHPCEPLGDVPAQHLRFPKADQGRV